MTFHMISVHFIGAGDTINQNADQLEGQQWMSVQSLFFLMVPKGLSFLHVDSEDTVWVTEWPPFGK